MGQFLRPPRRSRRRGRAPRGPRAGASGGDPRRTPAARRAGPVHARARPRPRPRARDRGRGLRPAGRGGLPAHEPRRPDARGGRARPAAGARRLRPGARRPSALRPPPRRPGRRRVPAGGVDARAAPRARGRARPRAHGGAPRGRPERRAALAAYLGRTRGVLADPDRIVVCAGYTQALGALCHALRDAGVRTAAMEDPCLHHQREVAASAGVRVAPLAVDRDGARPDALAAAAGGVGLTPPHQFPLGGTRAPERRAALVARARAGGTVLVEDDYDGEFRYGRQPVGALQGLAPDHVVYAGTTSKTLAPGLRLGWLVLPARQVEPVVEAKRVYGDTQVLEQLALAELVRSGAVDRHVRRMRQRYRRRRDALLATLADHVPALRARGIAAGLHLVLDLPDGVREDDVVARGARPSLAVGALAPFRHAPAPGDPQGLVVGYAAAPEHAYGQSLVALGDVLAGVC